VDGVSREKIINELWSSDTAVDIEQGINAVVKSLRRALNDSPDEPSYIKTLPKRGYRLLVTPEWPDSMASAKPSGLWRVAVPTLLLTLLVGTVLIYRSHRVKPLTGKDTVVLSDFTNTTGDEVFDDALRQGLSAQLEQSPFLQLLSEQRIAETLSLMSQPKDAPLTPKLAREICQRTQSAASIEGSIRNLGTQYVLGLSAVNCRNGESLADEQTVAPDKEHVLKSLSSAATNLRKKLGESLSSVEKYDIPLDSVTTSSLEALKAYSIGRRALNVDDNYATAIALGKRASDLDPDFAMAYMLQGFGYVSLNESERATENIRAAYKLRDRVSQYEKFVIESAYMEDVARNLTAARKEYELWAQVYPRDGTPPAQLGDVYLALGDYEGAVSEYQKTLKLDPESGMEYVNLASAYMFLNRPDEAEAAIRDAQARHLDSPADHVILFVAAFLRHDSAAMDHEKSRLMREPGYEDQVLSFESDGAAYVGQFRKARELSGSAADSAQRADEKEVAASYVAESALRDALVGNFEPAKQQAKAALARSNGSEVEAMAAIAFALAGESAEAERLGADLNKRFPEDTIVQLNYLPLVRTATALHGDSAKALQVIAPAERYELGFIGNGADFNGYPVYFRAQALLASHQGEAAAAAFQKVIDHPGVVLNEPISVLANLGLGRAYALSGDTAKARAAYQKFLNLWKDADPDIPIYKQAKTEYAALKSL
jgi:tetratricopeptide (TPR) repeat protein